MYKTVYTLTLQKKRESIALPNIPAGEYTGIKFSIGVAPKYNDNLSLQAGELSQLSGMTNISWMWHTSYIFTSLQGTVTEGATSKDFVAETGLNSNYKSVNISLTNKLNVAAASTSTLTLKMDVSKLFSGLDLISTPVIGASQAAAMTQLANNYTSAITATTSK